MTNWPDPAVPAALTHQSTITFTQIGDFGLARDLGREELYQSTGGKIPVKWTAPEVK